MKRFNFPLERVRRWRSEQANVEELKLEQLRNRVAKLGDEMRELAVERARSQQEVLAQPLIDSFELESLDAFRLHAAAKIRDLETQQRQCEGQVAEQRGRYVEARRSLELLERLKHRAFEKWQIESDREQEALAAESYLARMVREGQVKR